MTSYNRLNGTYTNEHPHLYEILRGEWGYDGMVVTDWGAENELDLGIAAGQNLEMPGSNGLGAVTINAAAVNEGARTVGAAQMGWQGF